MKERILLVCGNGYVFQEVFVPLIYQLNDECLLHVWVADYFVSDTTRDLITQVSQLSNVESIKVIAPYRLQESRYQWHQRIVALVKEMGHETFNGVVLSTDFQVFDKYIITLLRKKIRLFVVLQTGTLIHVLQAYRRLNAKQDSMSKADVDAIEIFLNCARWFKRFLQKLKLNIVSIINHYLIPIVLTGQGLPSRKLDNLNFCSGYADYAIVYDEQEQQALQQLVPELKRVHVAQHPAAYYAKNKNLIKQQRMLVIFSGNLSTEMRLDYQKEWVCVISSICREFNIQQIDMRFHPRILLNMQWPEVIIGQLKDKGFTVSRVDPLKVSLIDSMSQYEVVIGGPSGALRVAQAVNPSLKIYGFPNHSDGGIDDQEWILGNGEGISWITDVDRINLSSQSIIRQQQTVAQIIKRLVRET